VDARQCDQPYRVDEREQETESTEGDGDASSEVLGGGGIFATGFGDAGEDRRGDGEEHDDKGVCPVDEVSQATAPNAVDGVESHNDHGCASYSALQKKAENRRVQHRDERSWREHMLIFFPRKVVKHSRKIFDKDEKPEYPSIVECCRTSEFIPTETAGVFLQDEELIPYGVNPVPGFSSGILAFAVVGVLLALGG